MYNLKSAAVSQTQRETLQSHAETQGVNTLVDTPALFHAIQYRCALNL